MEIPLLAEVRHLLKVQRAIKGEPEYLQNYIAASETHHDVAAGYLAVWVYLGVEPDLGSSNPGILLAVALYENIKRFVDIEVPMRTKLERLAAKGLTTTVMDNGGYSLGMSDAARREAAAQRALEGKGEYKGMRFIKPKNRGNLNGVYGERRHQNQIGW